MYRTIYLLSITTHSRTYRLLKREYQNGCNWCNPHKGCNKRGHSEFPSRNWKTYRKKQYRN